jgi:hypothetical protein
MVYNGTVPNEAYKPVANYSAYRHTKRTYLRELSLSVTNGHFMKGVIMNDVTYLRQQHHAELCAYAMQRKAGQAANGLVEWLWLNLELYPVEIKQPRTWLYRKVSECLTEYTRRRNEFNNTCPLQ